MALTALLGILFLKSAGAHGPEFADLMSYDRTELTYSGSSRRLVDQDWAALRIHVHTGELETQISDPTDLKYVKDDLLPAATQYLSEVFKVRPVTGPLQFEQQCASRSGSTCVKVSPSFQSCGDATIPRSHFRDRSVCTSFWPGSCTVSKGGPGIADTDFALYVTNKQTPYCSNGVVAYASTCRQDSNDRPIAGFINMCKFNKNLQSDVSIFLHETLHAFGFSSSAFAFFRNDDGSPRTERNRNGYPPWDSATGRYKAASNTIKEYKEADGSLRHAMVLPRVIAAARRHYACTELSRMPLEEAGDEEASAFSHWDEREMHSDLMAASLSASPIMSDITLALFEDSGWYKPVYAKAASFQFGRGKGCGFLNDACVENGVTKFPGTFCPTTTTRECSSNTFPETLGCTHDLMGKAVCDNCVHSQALPTKFQHFASNPRLGGSGKFRGFCPMWVPYYSPGGQSFCNEDHGAGNSKALGESFGTTSRCIASTVFSPKYSRSALAQSEGSCRHTKCEETGVQIRVGDHWIFCGVSDEGTAIPARNGWYGTITCPSYETLCGGRGYALESTCPFPSSWRNGRCVCAPGYMNEDCTVEDTFANRKKYPYGLQYATDELVLRADVPFPQDQSTKPSISGNIAGLSFSVSPPLPAGLVLSPSDGVIRGMATAPSYRTAHTIRAAAAQGAATATLFVTALCPSSNSSCVPPTPIRPTSTTSPVPLPVTPVDQPDPVTPVDQKDPTEAEGSPPSQGNVTQENASREEPIDLETTQVEEATETWLFKQTWFQISVAVCAVLLLLVVLHALMCACRRKRAEEFMAGTLHVAHPQARSHHRGTVTGVLVPEAQSRHTPRSALSAQGASTTPRPGGVMPEASRPRQDQCIAQMLDMGYELDVALSALENNSWDVERAVVAVSQV